jgi:hypothetical protein
MEDLSNIEQTLVLREEDGTVGLRIGLIFTAYFRQGHSLPVREAVLKVLALWLDTVAGQVNWTQKSGALKWRRFQAETLPDLAKWLRDYPSSRSWNMAFHGGEKSLDASAIFFRTFCKADWSPHGLDHITLGLPLTWFADHPGSFPEFCRTLCAVLRPISGYGGIGIMPANGDMLATSVEPHVFEIAQRFPGIEVDQPIVHGLYIEDDIKGVNWLTVLGDALVARVGGAEKLGPALLPPAQLLPYDGGLIVQSGPLPKMGDRNANRKPIDYVAVNRVLKALRAPDTSSFHHANGGQRFDRAASLAWLARFDD